MLPGLISSALWIHRFNTQLSGTGAQMTTRATPTVARDSLAGTGYSGCHTLAQLTIDNAHLTPYLLMRVSRCCPVISIIV
ncbi:hypothetical protein GE09DRAFT_566833 [Coniochaeta sp. 2T2.1]|nr:hypothetical protein GE09DRAFT_566833 [Coniochaeta sp. 2T2.1]